MRSTISLLVAVVLCLSTIARAAIPEPGVEGPIPGNAYMTAPAPEADLKAHRYTEEEFFLSGTARRFTLDGALPEDGRARARPSDTAPYRTRLLVRRPANPEDFNGTVVVEWLNVSALSDGAPDFGYLHRHLLREGYAWVGVSAQKAGLYGMPGRDTPIKPVAVADPERYGTLEHPGDAYAFDIFAQAGRAIRNPDTGVLGGLPAQRLLANGESQSAFFMVTYVNAVAPLAKAYDGFLIHARGGNAIPLSGIRPERSNPDYYNGAYRIREDSTVPVLTVQSETDVITLASHQARQPDSDRFRLWEIPGAAHADTYLLKATASDAPGTPVATLAAQLAATDQIMGTKTELPINAGPQQHYIMHAALHHLNRWVRDGQAPPEAPRLWLADTAPATLAKDQHGLARGGIRTPWVDVPTAILSGLDQRGAGFAFLFGTTRPFSPEKLASLYPGGKDDYMARFTEATDAAIKAGFLLEADREEIIALADAMFPAIDGAD
jgi:hypothetical protein